MNRNIISGENCEFNMYVTQRVICESGIKYFFIFQLVLVNMELQERKDSLLKREEEMKTEKLHVSHDDKFTQFICRQFLVM